MRPQLSPLRWSCRASLPEKPRPVARRTSAARRRHGLSQGDQVGLILPTQVEAETNRVGAARRLLAIRRGCLRGTLPASAALALFALTGTTKTLMAATAASTERNRLLH